MNLLIFKFILPLFILRTTTFGASGAGGATNLSMRQLEEKLNKWLVELKEQEERFLRQAAHVNSWDQILQKGHDEVHSLKETLNTVKVGRIKCIFYYFV